MGRSGRQILVEHPLDPKEEQGGSSGDGSVTRYAGKRAPPEVQAVRSKPSLCASRLQHQVVHVQPSRNLLQPHRSEDPETEGQEALAATGRFNGAVAFPRFSSFTEES